MSLLPPTPFVMSKVKFLLRDRLKDKPPLLKKAEKLLGPFYRFQLRATVRDIGALKVQELSNIDDIIECKNDFDCIDTCLNMHTRLSKRLEISVKYPALIKVWICGHPEGKPNQVSDMFQNEFGVNTSGMSFGQVPTTEKKRLRDAMMSKVQELEKLIEQDEKNPIEPVDLTKFTLPTGNDEKKTVAE